MKKTFAILGYELLVTLTRRSFLFTAFGLPLILGLVFAGLSLVTQDSPGAMTDILSPPPPVLEQAHGYIDQDGLLQAFPPDLPPDILIPFGDEAAANQALAAGEIASYSIIHPGYVETGRITLVKPDFNPMQSLSQNWMLQYVLNYNLLGSDVEYMQRVQNPFALEMTNLEPPPAPGEAGSEPGGEAVSRDAGMLGFYVPYGVTFLFYMVIMFAASMLLNSVTREKENRVIEILMSTVTPSQLLAGKIFGLGLAGLLQTTIWAGMGYTLLSLSGRSFNVPAELIPPVSILAWALVFFLLGYLLYASLMAAVGALVPSLREASQATFVIIMPMLASLMFVGVVIDDPHGSLALALSLVPFTAPVSMMTRLASASVPLWQILLSITLLIATVILVVRLVAGMFRAQTLLSGQSFSLGRFMNALRGRA